MKLRYDPHFDLTYEAALLLQAFCAGGEEKSVLEHIHETFPSMMLSEAQKAYLGRIQDFLDGIREKLALTAEETSLLRPDYGAKGANDRGSSVLFPFSLAFGLGLDEVVRTVENTDEASLRGFFLDHALENEALSQNHGAVPLEAFLHEVLGCGEWPAEDKCHVADAFLDFHEAFRRAAAVMRRAIALLERETAGLSGLLAEWNAEVEPMIRRGEQDPLFARLLESVPVIKRLDMEMTVRPGLAMFTGLLVAIHGNARPGLDRLFSGVNGGLISIGLAVLVLEEVLLSSEQVGDAELLPILKMLSDKSKYDILCILRQSPCYGAQLAQKLGLSPATISHHMSALLSLQLVQFDAQENKMYYRLNPARFSGLVEKLRGTFLG